MNKIKDLPIFVALDLDTDSDAIEIAKKASDYVGGFKVGPRLVVKYGESLIKKLSEMGEVFVDNKYFDIPTTTCAAIQSTFNAGASFATVHAQNGLETLRDLAQLEKGLNKERAFKILSVTVLTSFSKETLPLFHQSHSIEDQVNQLAKESIESGLSGIVCSASEVNSLREQFSNSFLVTPGIRLPEDEVGDQKRVFGPKEALIAGASALVVGRPIYKAKDPKKAAQRFFDAIQS